MKLFVANFASTATDSTVQTLKILYYLFAIVLFDNTQGFEMILNKRESKNFSSSMQNFISEKLHLQKESQCASQS